MSTAPLLIGLTGRAGAGKSTVAAYLEDQYGCCEIAFADPIVNMLGALLADANISGAWMTERALKELPTPLGFSYRHLAQTLGTEWGRGLAPDFWVRVAALRVQALQAGGDNVVISDVRFHNEAAFIQAHGGVVVRVLRQDLPHVRPHASEAQVDHLPATTELLNFGSLATLHDQVDRLIDTLRRMPAVPTKPTTEPPL